jgi:hypothetical protein
VSVPISGRQGPLGPPGQRFGRVQWGQESGRPSSVSVPIFGRPASLDRKTGAWSGPPGQNVRSPKFCVCPHIWSRADYPMVAQIPCLSPYLGAPPAWTAQPALGQVHRAKTFGRPNFVSVPIFGCQGRLGPPDRCLVWSGGVNSRVADTQCLSPYLVPGRLPNVKLRRPRCGDRTARWQRSRY